MIAGKKLLLVINRKSHTFGGDATIKDLLNAGNGSSAYVKVDENTVYLTQKYGKDMPKFLRMKLCDISELVNEAEVTVPEGALRGGAGGPTKDNNAYMDAVVMFGEVEQEIDWMDFVKLLPGIIQDQEGGGVMADQIVGKIVAGVLVGQKIKPNAATAIQALFHGYCTRRVVEIMRPALHLAAESVSRGDIWSAETSRRCAVTSVRCQLRPGLISSCRPALIEKGYYILTAKVKPLQGEDIEVSVWPWQTVLLVKECVEQETGYAPATQRLLFGGKQMNDNRTVADYNIEDGSVLHLVLATHGGGAGGPTKDNNAFMDKTASKQSDDEVDEVVDVKAIVKGFLKETPSISNKKLVKAVKAECPGIGTKEIKSVAEEIKAEAKVAAEPEPAAEPEAVAEPAAEPAAEPEAVAEPEVQTDGYVEGKNEVTRSTGKGGRRSGRTHNSGGRRRTMVGACGKVFSGQKHTLKTAIKLHGKYCDLCDVLDLCKLCGMPCDNTNITSTIRGAPGSGYGAEGSVFKTTSGENVKITGNADALAAVSQMQELRRMQELFEQMTDTQFFVKTDVGTLTLPFVTEMPVEVVKMLVCYEMFNQHNFYVPTDHMRLMFGGKQLEDDGTLGSYGVAPDNTLFLFGERNRGGMERTFDDLLSDLAPEHQAAAAQKMEERDAKANEKGQYTSAQKLGGAATGLKSLVRSEQALVHEQKATLARLDAAAATMSLNQNDLKFLVKIYSDPRIGDTFDQLIKDIKKLHQTNKKRKKNQLAQEDKKSTLLNHHAQYGNKVSNQETGNIGQQNNVSDADLSAFLDTDAPLSLGDRVQGGEADCFQAALYDFVKQLTVGISKTLAEVLRVQFKDMNKSDKKAAKMNLKLLGEKIAPFIEEVVKPNTEMAKMLDSVPQLQEQVEDLRAQLEAQPAAPADDTAKVKQTETKLEAKAAELAKQKRLLKESQKNTKELQEELAATEKELAATEKELELYKKKGATEAQQIVENFMSETESPSLPPRTSANDAQQTATSNEICAAFNTRGEQLWNQLVGYCAGEVVDNTDGFFAGGEMPDIDDMVHECVDRAVTEASTNNLDAMVCHRGITESYRDIVAEFGPEFHVGNHPDALQGSLLYFPLRGAVLAECQRRFRDHHENNQECDSDCDQYDQECDCGCGTVLGPNVPIMIMSELTTCRVQDSVDDPEGPVFTQDMPVAMTETETIASECRPGGDPGEYDDEEIAAIRDEPGMSFEDWSSCSRSGFPEDVQRQRFADLKRYVDFETAATTIQAAYRASRNECTESGSSDSEWSECEVEGCSNYGSLHAFGCVMLCDHHGAGHCVGTSEEDQCAVCGSYFGDGADFVIPADTSDFEDMGDDIRGLFGMRPLNTSSMVITTKHEGSNVQFFKNGNGCGLYPLEADSSAVL
eukprot:COSAG04_NODE_2401_length_4203_cov_38.096979_1_plen_1401_part_11